MSDERWPDNVRRLADAAGRARSDGRSRDERLFHDLLADLARRIRDSRDR